MGKKNKFWEFKIRAESDGKSADLYIYGPISEFSWLGDEVTPKQFVEDLKALGDIEVLNVFINSPGGDVFASQAIYSQLKRHKAQVNVYVDGLAASGASLIAMAGDTVIMPKNAMMMIHNPWLITLGDSNELRELADFLDKIRESMLSAYTEKSGLSEDEVISLLDAETWMTAEEAVEKGFADKLEESKAVAASLIDGQILAIGNQRFDMSRFSNFPGDRVAKAKPKQKEVDNVELTLEILAEKYPEIHNAVKKVGYEEGIKAERDRMKAIDELAVPGADEIISKAKYETGASAEAVAMDILKAQREKGKNFLADVIEDAQNLDGIKPNAIDDEDQELKSVISAFAKGANAKR